MSLASKLGLREASPEEREAARNFSYRDRVGFLKPDVKQFRLPKEGQSVHLRFLPIGGIGIWYKQFRAHYKVGAGNASVLCPTNFKKTCAICAARDKIVLRIGAEAAKDDPTAKKLSIKRINLSYVIDRKNTQNGVQVWIISGKETVENIVKAATDRKTKVERSVDHPDSAYDVLFDRVKSEKKVPGVDEMIVNENIGIDPDGPTPLSADEDQAEAWLKFTLDNPVESIINEISPKEVEKMLFGDEGFSDEDSSPDSADYSETVKEDDAPEPAVETDSDDSLDEGPEEEAAPAPKLKVAPEPQTNSLADIRKTLAAKSKPAPAK